MKFQPYRPDQFSDISDSEFAGRLWRFLTRSDILLRMDTATYLRRPACEAIQEELIDEFKEFQHNSQKTTRYKQMCGHMVRQIMEQKEYVIDSQRIPLRVGSLFRTATRYKKYQPKKSD
jgi:hypothetical protein